jgi:hypothetical protein
MRCARRVFLGFGLVVLFLGIVRVTYLIEPGTKLGVRPLVVNQARSLISHRFTLPLS